eukprot:1145233-Pleurochrysis_carterae.AAC.4
MYGNCVDEPRLLSPTGSIKGDASQHPGGIVRCLEEGSGPRTPRRSDECSRHSAVNQEQVARCAARLVSTCNAFVNLHVK